MLSHSRVSLSILATLRSARLSLLLAFALSSTVWPGAKPRTDGVSIDARTLSTNGDEGLPATNVLDIAVTPADPKLIYVVTRAGLFRTDDAGGHWTPINPTQNAGQPAGSVDASPTDASLVYCSQRDGLWFSRDRGDNWAEVMQLSKGTIWNVVIAPDDQDTVYLHVCTACLPLSVIPPACQFELHRTTDGGQRWLSLPIDQKYWVSRPAVGKNGRLYNIQVAGGLRRSDDRGETWVSTDSIPSDVYEVFPAPSDSTLLYAFSNRTVWQSLDSGDTWNQIADFTPNYVDELVVDPLNSDRVYVTAEHLFMITASRRVVRRLTGDKLDTWEIVMTPNRRFLLAALYIPDVGLRFIAVPPVSNRVRRRVP